MHHIESWGHFPEDLDCDDKPAPPLRPRPLPSQLHLRLQCSKELDCGRVCLTDLTHHKCLVNYQYMDINHYFWLRIPSRHPTLLEFANHMKATILAHHQQNGHPEYPPFPQTSVRLIEDLLPTADLEHPTTLDLEKANYDYIINGFLDPVKTPRLWAREVETFLLMNRKSYTYLPQQCSTCKQRLDDAYRYCQYWFPWLRDVPMNVRAFSDSLKHLGGQVGDWDVDPTLIGDGYTPTDSKLIPEAATHLQHHAEEYRSHFRDDRSPRRLRNITLAKKRNYALRGVQRAILLMANVVSLPSWFERDKAIPGGDPFHLFLLGITNCVRFCYESKWELCHLSSLTPFDIPIVCSSSTLGK